ncbi:MAG: FAD-dependent oxidoreductase, partial [Sneathiellales bacterium]|nr:FAD-dependent oxidoreductase [Sneathiellales bacterium]
FVDDLILAEGLYAFEQAVLEPVSRVEREWAGLRTFSPDRNPVVGFEPTSEGFFWLAGQGGYGI